METKRAALRVGMFVISGVFALLALVFFLSGSALHPGIAYESYFQENVQGLDVGGAVKFRGVTIGKVTDIGLVSAEYPPPPGDENKKVYQQVVVRFRVDPLKIGRVDSGNAIAHGLRVQTAPLGITGLAYLELSFVNPATFPANAVPWTPDSIVIPSIPSTLAQLQDTVEQVMGSFGKVDLTKMAEQISSLITALNSEITTGDAHQALANASTLLSNLDTTVAQSNLPATTLAARNLADGPQTRQILAKLNDTTAQLDKVSKQLPALIAASQSTINQADETTADLQARLLPILADMKAATSNLRDLTASLQRNPSQVILGAPPPAQGAVP